MGKRQFELECMISSSVNIVTKGWYICMDRNRGCVSSWEITQVLGSGYSPPGMVVHIVEVGPDSYYYYYYYYYYCFTAYSKLEHKQE